MNQLLILLKNRNFKIFFFTSIIANIGINITLVGINWFIMDYTNQNGLLGNYTTISLISGFILSFFIGTLIDNNDKCKIIRYCNIIQGIVLLMIIIALNYKCNILIVIYSLAIINSIGFSLYSTASRSLIQDISEKENLIYGNSMIEISLQIGAIVASFITGIFYEYYGFISIMILTISLLFISGIFINSIKYNSSINLLNKEGYFSELSKGMNYLLNNKYLLMYGIVVFIPFIVTLMSNNVLPGYVKDHLNSSSIVYGTADMLFGVGALLSGILISSIIKKIPRNILQLIMFSVSIISLLFLTINKSIICLYILYFCFGLANSSLKVILNTYLMEYIDKSIFGRILAFFSSLSNILQAILVTINGRLMDSTDVIYGYLVLSIIMMIGFISINMLKFKINSFLKNVNSHNI